MAQINKCTIESRSRCCLGSNHHLVVVSEYLELISTCSHNTSYDILACFSGWVHREASEDQWANFPAWSL